MKKTIIAAAVAASVAAPAAFAEVTVYGKIHQSMNNASGDVTVTATTLAAAAYDAVALEDGEFNGADLNPAATGNVAGNTATATGSADYNDMTSNASRFGVKGSEDLGNGMSAFFQMEVKADVSDGSANFGDARDAFVGVKGDFGKVTLGRMGGPTKGMLYGSIVEAADTHVFGGASQDMANNFASAADRVSNVVAYSNNVGALSFTVAGIGTDGNLGTEDGNHFGGKTAGVSFDAAPGLKINAAWLDSDNSGKDTQLFGATYTMGALKVGAVMEKADQVGKAYNGYDFSVYDTNAPVAGIDADRDTWGVSAAYTMGNNVVSLGYVKGETDYTGMTAGESVNAEDTSTYVTLTHKLSNRTSVYASYYDLNADVAYLDAGTASVDVELDVSNLGLGIVHNF